MDIDNNLPYYKIARSDFAVYLNMTEEQWQRISLLAYYGYQYKENGYDHSAKKWYVITQVMIWRTAVPTSRIVFTDTLNGKDLPNKFASEIAEMEDLLSIILNQISILMELNYQLVKVWILLIQMEY